MRNKRVLLLIESYNGYGAEKMLLWLGNNLCNYDYDVTFCSIYDNVRRDNMDERAKFEGFAIKRRENFLLSNMTYFIFGLLHLLKLFIKGRYDYVVTFRATPFVLLLLCKPFYKGAKLIMAERNDPNAATTKLSRYKQRLFRFASGLVCQTEGAKKYFEDRGIKVDAIIPNPIDIPDVLWHPNESYSIACVGRLRIEQKRQDVMIIAFKEIVKKYPTAVLTFYGDGIDKNKLVNLVNDSGLQKNVVFAGKVTDVLEKLSYHHIFALTSDYEGIPNSLMEAMSIGMPVISTDCRPGGTRFLIDNGVNGVIVPVNNPHLLADQIEIMFGSSDLCCKYGINARKSIKRLMPESIIKLWIEFFKQL